MDKPDLYDPRINRSYAELATHYGTLIDPARAFKPKDKPRVERPMTYHEVNATGNKIGDLTGYAGYSIPGLYGGQHLTSTASQPSRFDAPPDRATAAW